MQRLSNSYATELASFNPFIDYYQVLVHKVDELNSLQPSRNLFTPYGEINVAPQSPRGLGHKNIEFSNVPGSDSGLKRENSSQESRFDSSQAPSQGDFYSDGDFPRQPCSTPHVATLHHKPRHRTRQTLHQCPHPSCLKICGASGTLKAHLATHTKERRFKCTLCHASYTTNNRLTVHMRGHTGERPYSCTFPGCDYHAKQKCSLDNHSLKHEEKREIYARNQRTIPCNECGRYYKTLESLDQHCWRDHGKGAGSALKQPKETFG